MSDNRSATPASVSSSAENQAVLVAKIQLKLLSTITAYNKKNNSVLQYSFAIKSTKLILELDIVPEMKNHRTTAGGRGARRRRKKRREMLQSDYEQNNDQDFAVTIRGGIDEPVLDQSDNMQGGHNPSPAQASSQQSIQPSPGQASSQQSTQLS